jgi:hypothetical protein
VNVHPALMSKPRLLQELDQVAAEALRQKALADYWRAYADEVAERHRIDTAVAEIQALRRLVLTGRAPRTVLHTNRSQP